MTKPSETANLAIIEIANQWLLQMQDGLSNKEESAFSSWLRESPVHVREYLRAEALWLSLDEIDSGRRIDVDALLAEQASNVVSMDETLDNSGRKNTGSRRWLGAVAASLAMMALLFGGYWFSRAPETLHYATAVGEQRLVVLSDGSTIEMNTQTNLSVKLSEQLREIKLHNGEALFLVEKDKQRPFVVINGQTQVRAIGTQFNVHLMDDQVRVTVIEGQVVVENTSVDFAGNSKPTASESSAVMLAAGDAADVHSQGQITRHDANTEKAVAWTERRLIFEDEALDAVVAEFNRYNKRQMIIASEALAAQRITLILNADQPDSLLRFLSQNLPLVITEETSSRILLTLGE